MFLAIMLTAATSIAGVLHDPAQYIPRFLQIRTKAAELVPFRFNRAQLEAERQRNVARAAGRKERWLNLKSRQVGFSTYEVAQNFHKVATRRNYRVFTLAHKAEVAEVLFRTANLFYEKLPPILKPQRLTPRNKRNLNFHALNSYYGVGTSKDITFGRGDAVNAVHWSEAAYTPGSANDQEKLLTSIRHAAKKGSISIESTANGFGNLFESMVDEAERGIGEFNLIFVPWWFDDDCRVAVTEEQGREIMATLSDVEKMLVQKHGLDASQIAFRREENSTPAKRRSFPQEFPEDTRTCFLTSGISYFDILIVDELIRTTIDVPAREISGGTVRIWEEPQPGVEYCGGADTSEGIPGCDPNGIGIMRRDTGAQVCSVHGLFDPDELGDLIIQYSLKYNRALIGVERNNHGHAVLKHLKTKGFLRSQYEGGQVYFHSPSNEASNAKAGWPTDQVTRPVMISDLRSAIDNKSIHLRDLQMLYECRTFRKQPGGTAGKWAADPGKHDDSIMKWAIALQMRAHKIVRPGFFVAKAGI